jgi:ABC-type sulfate transport system permease component
MAHGTLRGSVAFCHFMTFASAVIVTGVVSYFLSQYPFRGAHIVYQEVIVRPNMVNQSRYAQLPNTIRHRQYLPYQFT